MSDKTIYCWINQYHDTRQKQVLPIIFHSKEEAKFNRCMNSVGQERYRIENGILIHDPEPAPFEKKMHAWFHKKDDSFNGIYRTGCSRENYTYYSKPVIVKEIVDE